MGQHVAQTFAVSSYCRWDWCTSPLVFATKAKCGHKESWSNAARTAERGDTGAGLGLLELLEEVADIGMLLEAHLELIQIYRTALWRVPSTMTKRASGETEAQEQDKRRGKCVRTLSASTLAKISSMILWISASRAFSTCSEGADIFFNCGSREHQLAIGKSRIEKEGVPSTSSRE